MTGARLFYEHPELFFRDCAECREWWIDEQTGKVQVGPDGEKLKRQVPVICKACRKEGWDGFTPESEEAFELFRYCEAFGKLPRPGGIEDQDPAAMRTLLLLKTVKANCEQADRSQRDAEIVGALMGR